MMVETKEVEHMQEWTSEEDEIKTWTDSVVFSFFAYLAEFQNIARD